MTDKTRVGIYYKKDKPENILRQLGIADFSIEIPAGEKLHHERGYVEFPADVMLYRVRPHAHSRGYATRLTVRYPDGREEILHNQPIYDFNWQREYVFKDWLKIPAGSVVIADYIFDNSVNNKSNPDPKANVLFGMQTFEEMLFTYLHYKIVGESLEISEGRRAARDHAVDLVLGAGRRHLEEDRTQRAARRAHEAAEGQFRRARQEWRWRARQGRVFRSPGPAGPCGGCSASSGGCAYNALGRKLTGVWR